MPNSAYRVTLRHRSGPLDLDVDFILDAPWTALFAPSGAGKTTILRMIAGLDRPQTGVIVDPNGDNLLDTATHTAVPPHRRGIRLVAQRPALFPNLKIFQNVGYGFSSRTTGTGPDTNRNIASRLQEVFELCRINHLLDKKPSQLSGGERQRVALARSLAASPMQLLLLDEPFTGLESDLRDDLIRDLRSWTAQRGIPVLLVTHDIGEVFAAQAHVLKMESGRIVASGPAHEVLGPERDRLIARLGQSQHG